MPRLIGFAAFFTLICISCQADERYNDNKLNSNFEAIQVSVNGLHRDYQSYTGKLLELRAYYRPKNTDGSESFFANESDATYQILGNRIVALFHGANLLNGLVCNEGYVAALGYLDSDEYSVDDPIYFNVLVVAALGNEHGEPEEVCFSSNQNWKTGNDYSFLRP